MTEPPPGCGPVDRLTAGSVLREWRIERFVARGAFGQVFAARRLSWVDGEPPRALKVFDPILSSAARAALLSEFELLRTMRHPNLVRGEDACRCRGRDTWHSPRRCWPRPQWSPVPGRPEPGSDRLSSWRPRS